jgi:hypothetical protein
LTAIARGGPDALAAHVAHADDELGERARPEEVDEVAAETLDLGQLGAVAAAARAVEALDLEAVDPRARTGAEQGAEVRQQPADAGIG